MKSLLSAGVALALAAVPVLVAAPVSATTITTVHRFNGTNGSLPGKIVVTGDGSIYGATYAGGENGTGTIFSLDSADAPGTFTTLYSFDAVGNDNINAGGANPASLGLVVHDTDDGFRIIGAAESGGANGGGTLFSISRTGRSFTTLHDFAANDSETDGSLPLGLIIDASGRLYGATDTGGNNGNGTLFSLVPDGAVMYAQLAADSSQGRLFSGAVALDPAGTVFATTVSGGADGGGTLVSLSGNGTLAKLHDFSGAAANPNFNIVLDSAGTLFGVSQGGAVWSRTSAGVFTTLHTFTDGENPSGLYLDSQGTLYGTTVNGGTSNQGTLWSRTSSGVFRTLASFTGDLAGPAWGLASDGAGRLFGVTLSLCGMNCTDEHGSIWSYQTGVVPEPGTWAMLIAGFGLTGATMRRRRAIAARA